MTFFEGFRQNVVTGVYICARLLGVCACVPFSVSPLTNHPHARLQVTNVHGTYFEMVDDCVEILGMGRSASKALGESQRKRTVVGSDDICCCFSQLTR